MKKPMYEIRIEKYDFTVNKLFGSLTAAEAFIKENESWFFRKFPDLRFNDIQAFFIFV